ncbi:MAG: hypothetical protein SPI18_06185 [Prevotella sp.]|nr:hypothetical protein [Prevotella sp.]MDY6130844.1 hypothetical protein [Prevotella sp.]
MQKSVETLKFSPFFLPGFCAKENFKESSAAEMLLNGTMSAIPAISEKRYFAGQEIIRCPKMVDARKHKAPAMGRQRIIAWTPTNAPLQNSRCAIFSKHL